MKLLAVFFRGSKRIIMNDLEKDFKDARKWAKIGIICYAISIVGWAIYLVGMLFIIIGNH